MVQYRQQILIVGARNCRIHADDAKVKPPSTQQEPLAGGQVFVEYQH